MIYFLGGPPRVGKSIVSRAIGRERGISVVSTDSLGAVLEHVLDPGVDPDLFVTDRFNARDEPERIRLMTEEGTTRIEELLDESRSVWRAVEAFARREEEEGRDVILEGVAVLPELVAGLDGLACRSIFVGYQGADHSGNLRKSAAETPGDWMRSASEGYIDAFACLVAQMSLYFEREARSRGLGYIAMEGRPLEEVVVRVADSLLV